ncbi:MAG: hypothetical protein KIT27_11475 [Legionellales bacterium]|nr:hypothetical protein [Legionellales bacterium]
MSNGNWPSQEQDLREANFIMRKYFNDESQVAVLDVSFNATEHQLKVSAPEWLVAVSHFFDTKYGSELGRRITLKVITKLLLRNTTIH